MYSLGGLQIEAESELWKLLFLEVHLVVKIIFKNDRQICSITQSLMTKFTFKIIRKTVTGLSHPRHLSHSRKQEFRKFHSFNCLLYVTTTTNNGMKLLRSINSIHQYFLASREKRQASSPPRLHFSFTCGVTLRWKIPVSKQSSCILYVQFIDINYISIQLQKTPNKTEIQILRYM